MQQNQGANQTAEKHLSAAYIKPFLRYGYVGFNNQRGVFFGKRFIIGTIGKDSGGKHLQNRDCSALLRNTGLFHRSNRRFRKLFSLRSGLFMRRPGRIFPRQHYRMHSREHFKDGRRQRKIHYRLHFCPCTEMGSLPSFSSRQDEA